MPAKQAHKSLIIELKIGDHILMISMEIFKKSAIVIISKCSLKMPMPKMY